MGQFRAIVDTTDARSRKVAQVSRDPRVEACWYFAESREQFRLSGRIEWIGPGHPALSTSRDDAWAALGDAARRSFAWPEPGRPFAGDDAFRVAEPDPSRPPDVFLLAVLWPDEVEHLELAADPQVRRAYRREGITWLAERINP